jgi:hypothetical protein
MREQIRKILKELFSGDGSVTFIFRDMKAFKPKYGPWRVYFNGLKIKDGQYSHGENTYIDLIGNGIELRGINSRDFMSDGKSGYVELYKLKRIKPNIDEILFGSKDSGEVNSTLIRSALKKAFPNNWKERDKIYTTGIRDINTIGERTGKGESWSIMNYFDTKKEVQEKISQKWNNEGKGDLEEWLVDVFKNDNDFMKELLDIQWRSIENGYNTEVYASEVISNHIPGNVEFFPPGSIIDRYDSIDMIIGGESFQIKPLSGLLVKDGKYFVKTYGMKSYYKGKRIDYIVYARRGGEVYIFPNKNYEVGGDGREVIHFEKPTIY